MPATAHFSFNFTRGQSDKSVVLCFVYDSKPTSRVLYLSHQVIVLLTLHLELQSIYVMRENKAVRCYKPQLLP